MSGSSNPYAPPRQHAVRKSSSDQPKHERLPMSLAEALEEALQPHGFLHYAADDNCNGLLLSAWRRRTFNSNRAVILIDPPGGTSTPQLGPLLQQHKIELGKAVGYFPFFYGVGLQLVVRGAKLTTPLENLTSFVDSIDNQRAIIQSVHLVDESAGTFQSARTWGQVLSAPFQDAIEAALAAQFNRLTPAS